jgi:glycosyltransferase involved in cell wall biosynthesis
VPYKPKFILVSTKNMKKIIQDYQPDLVWIHTIGNLGMEAAKIAKNKYKIVYTKHCFDGELWNSYLNVPKPFCPFVDFLARRIENKILCAANQVIYHLNDTSKVEKSKYFNKFILTAPPLPARFFENRKPKNTDKNKLILGFCGRCDPDKGIEDTFKGLEIFHEKHPEIELEFVLIGNGSEAQRMIEKYRFLEIKVTGYVNDVIPHLDKLDAFVLSSKQETTSLSSLEAYARGLTVFSLPIGYLSEKNLEIDNFYLFKNKEELAENIYKVLVLKNESSKKNLDSISSLVISYAELYGRVSKNHIL